jgi:hypothetical protein
MAREVSRLLLGFHSGSSRVGFVVDKVALGQVSFVYFGFSCQSFHLLLHIHHHTSSRAGTAAQIAADVTRGLSHPTLYN